MATVDWPVARNRLERIFIGPAMAVLAWLLERIVVRSARRG